MKPANCKPGLRVRYWPYKGASQSYVGTVRTDPWQLGDGSWVVHLKDLDRPERPYVHAASVKMLEPVHV